jgi:hypothetical protein
VEFRAQSLGFGIWDLKLSVRFQSLERTNWVSGFGLHGSCSGFLLGATV